MSKSTLVYMKDIPLWVYILILFLVFLGTGVYFIIIGIYAYSIAMFALTISVIIIKYMIMPGNVSKKYWLIVAVLLFLIAISVLNPDAVNTIVNRLFP